MPNLKRSDTNMNKYPRNRYTHCWVGWGVGALAHLKMVPNSYLYRKDHNFHVGNEKVEHAFRKA
jgi:hypothetical protein